MENNKKLIKNILTVGSGSSGVLLNDDLEDIITFKHQDIKKNFDGNAIIDVDFDGMMGVALSNNNQVYRFGECDLVEGENKKRQIHKKPQLLKLNPKIQITNIACGWNHAVIYNKISENPQIFGFGSNTFGELGLGKVQKKFINEPVQINLQTEKNNSKIDFIHCGFRQTYVKLNNGDFYVTGQNKKFELGINIEQTKQTYDFIKNENQEILAHLKNLKNNFQTGQKFVCFLDENNELYAWGDNKYKQISNKNEEIIQKIEKITDKKIQQFSLGWNHILALQTDGHLYMRGRNDMGQLSHGTQNNIKNNKNQQLNNQNNQQQQDNNNQQQKNQDQPQNQIQENITPIKKNIIQQNDVQQFENKLLLNLKNDEKIKQIACGSECNYFLTNQHRVFAWGWNEHGNLGDGTLLNAYEIKEIGIDSKCQHEEIKAKGAICYLIEKE
ncbi:Regulator of chromosome condensation 1/beta-lactamase-inhibitor protein II [Pseudocohnilembus persalinus]|uniref:Regulator of chromosome condensation 1/beta-lactamase-inhibitor protein II n=1 Tax=Pseudocohnilembus persalinus TaxID=266149 RepID=A0A0V0QKH8_PSEPJ|nr:Regulator of chromosome condensation 1/beta-lactamase-inhibitor protein II [Pseudocohnilembus persalinus]|eukprot:KRX02750.1 Regulator of chromosome condensation 1/beta-lactamase-inhibitor protein II [Pseudocohnilembus persalinus]